MIESGETSLSIEALDPEISGRRLRRAHPTRGGASRGSACAASRSAPTPDVRALGGSRSGSARRSSTSPTTPSSTAITAARSGSAGSRRPDRVRFTVVRRRHRHPGRRTRRAIFERFYKVDRVPRARAGRRAARRQRRPRPGDRAPHRRGARWLGRRQLRGGRRLDVLDRGSAGRRLTASATTCRWQAGGRGDSR